MWSSSPRIFASFSVAGCASVARQTAPSAHSIQSYNSRRASTENMLGFEQVRTYRDAVVSRGRASLTYLFIQLSISVTVWSTDSRPE